MKIISRLIVTTLVTLGLLTTLTLASHAVVHADAATDAACQGVALTGGSCDTSGNGSADKKINSVLSLVINTFSVVVGVTAVIMVIIGGFKYITSMGDSASVNSAKNTILYAIIGLVIVALAQVIVHFVINKV